MSDDSSLFVRLLRFVAWACVAIGVLVLLSTAYTYAPCFMGEPGACLSGILLLMGGVLALAFCGFGGVVLFFTRRRATNGPGAMR